MFHLQGVAALRRLRTDTQGGIYLEALVALAILAIALVPMIGAFAATPTAQQESGEYLTAMNVARERLEELHDLSGAQWDALQDRSSSTEINGVRYSWDRTVTRRPQPPPQVEGEEPEEGDPLADLLLDVSVTVTWTDRTGDERQVTLATSVARRP